MTLTIELTPEQEAKLQQQAWDAGVQPSDVIVQLIDSLKPNVKMTKAKDGVELLARLDALGFPPGYGDPSIDSPELARQLSAQLSKRNGSV
jgi:hypothetical protein